MRRTRVLVVDDSVVVRRLVTDSLSVDPRIEVVGVAPNGRVALAKLDQLAPDVVTLDVEMPVMDGLETLEELQRLRPALPVIMFSTLTDRGARTTLDALERGASDYVTKPANVGSVRESMEAVRAQLVPRILALTERSVSGATPGHRPSRPTAPGVSVGAGGAGPGPPAPTGAAGAGSGSSAARVDVVAIGVSTGGPDALATLLPALPANLPVPVLVVQHMPPVFTTQLAARLDRRCDLTVVEATPATPLRPGSVLLAPGDFHVRARRAPAGAVVSLDQGPRENFCRPAVDVLFRSVAEVYGAGVLAVVLTGMGADGAAGAVDVVAGGGRLIAQDEHSSVVWGMPGAVVRAGLADRVLPLRDVAPTIARRVRAGRGAPAGQPA